MSAKPKKQCLVILSEKSSGSSALHNFLSSFGRINRVSSTRHFSSETLYWTKAASVLGLPQINMVDSEVPIPKASARKDLVTLLENNLENYSAPKDDRELIFGGWEKLCEKFTPVYLEKSPHHLCQWSALELLLESMEKFEEIDYLLLGLVRNPLDSVYSQFTRRRSRPEELEKQWCIAYTNLLKLKPLAKETLQIIRYEDIVASQSALDPVLEFCGYTGTGDGKNYFHAKSLGKWRADNSFGFTLSDETKELAMQFGYTEEELSNSSNALWPVYRESMRAAYQVKRAIGQTIGK